jgi:hypothetical protein
MPSLLNGLLNEFKGLGNDIYFEEILKAYIYIIV